MIQDHLNATLKTDKDKLSQVIRNLLSNAFKFTKQGSVSLSMEPHPDRTQCFKSKYTIRGLAFRPTNTP